MRFSSAQLARLQGAKALRSRALSASSGAKQPPHPTDKDALFFPELALRARERNNASSRGMVLWLTLVAMCFFVALAMYVANLGHHAEKQQATQDAADACAIGAAGQMARSFNLVAQNNLEITRLITAAQMLDAMPQATAYTRADQEAMLVSVQALPAPSGGPYASLVALAAQDKADTASDLQAQVDALRPVVDTFYGNYANCAPDALQDLAVGNTDIRESTWYQTPSGQKGALWKAAEALDKVSQATIDQLGLTAQTAATASAAKVQGTGAETLAGAAPLRVAMPCQRGVFDDFYTPIIRGEIPDASGGADALLHRGPYDTVYAWLRAIRAPGTSTPGTPAPGPAAPSDGSPFGGSNPGGSGGTFTPGPIIGYRPVGAFNHETWAFREQVGGPSWLGGGFGGQWGSLPSQIGVNTELTRRAGQLAVRKLMMAQNGAPPWNDAMRALTGNRTPPTLYVPHWLYPFEPARDAARAAATLARTNPAAARNLPINSPNAYAAWIRIESPARIPNATWEIMKIGQGQRFFRRGPAGTPPLDMFFEAPETAFRVKMGDGIYVTFTPAPIIDPKTGAVIGVNPSNPVVYLWAGINAPMIPLKESPDNAPAPVDRATGLPQWVNIGNPNNWTGTPSDLPAPTDLTPEYATPPTTLVPGQWSVLGFASQPNAASAWPARFSSANYQRHTGLAAARVFNNHSWDLWTPMWHAQLCPIAPHFDDWLALLQSTAGQAGDNDGVNTAELPGFVNYLKAVQPLAPLITH